MFFPYKDDNPTERAAVVTIAFIVINVLVWVFFQQVGLNDAAMANALCNRGMIPGELTGLAVGQTVRVSAGYACIVDPAPEWSTLITMQFLHGGWFHLVGNMLFLWIFGNNIEDAVGRFRFVLFYLICGVVAGVAQILADPASPVPAVGASGAVSGVLGAYLMLFPRARVWMFIWVFIFVQRVALPAWVYLIVWAGMQFYSGVADSMARASGQTSGGGVAFWAHIGGFLAGIILIHFFANRDYLRRHQLRGHIRRFYGN